MARTIYEMYENKEVYGALILKRLKPRVIGNLLNWIEDHLADYETISVHEWVGERFYILVNDHRIKEFPNSAAVGFTVDIEQDCIISSKADKLNNFWPGNCWVRGLKWKKLLNKRYPDMPNKQNFHWYKSQLIPSP